MGREPLFKEAEEGRCTTCGLRTHDVRRGGFMGRKGRKLVPRNDGDVLDGRCLRCNPSTGDGDSEGETGVSPPEADEPRVANEEKTLDSDRAPKNEGATAQPPSKDLVTAEQSSPKDDVPTAELESMRIEHPVKSTTREYAMEEVARHNKEGDCWIVIGNSSNGGPKVYNLSEYLDYHPGGMGILLDFAGKDADENFEDVGHSTYAREDMREFQIGVLKAEP